MKKFLYTFVLAAFFTTLIHASPKIETKEVAYTINGQEFKGFIAYPAIKDPKKKIPGVLVIHEWWGENEYARRRAKMLAELGYAAFALDMYGDGKSTDDPKQATQMMNDAVSSGQIQARFDGAKEALIKETFVDQDRLGAIGYCFGGNVVLSMARAGEPLKAVVSFHGAIPEKAVIEKDSIKANVLILSGADDKMAPESAVNEFEKDMKDAGAKVRVVFYKGALHAFTNPDATKLGKMHGMPIAYNKEADEKSWAEMKALFKKTL